MKYVKGTVKSELTINYAVEHDTPGVLSPYLSSDGVKKYLIHHLASSFLG